MALNRIRSWLFRGRNTPSQDSALPPPEDSLGPPEAEVFVLLRRALTDHCLLTVRIDGRGEPHTSAILEVVPEGRYLVIDELIPMVDQSLLEARPVLHIRAMVEGVELRFSTPVLQVGEEDGLPYYKIALPSSINYAQRRRQFRVTVPQPYGFEVSFTLPDERVLLGDLRDLSSGGLCVARLHSGELEADKDLHQIATCRLSIPNQQSVVADVEIMGIDAPPRQRVARVRARFINPSPTAARRISQFCTELERLHRQLR